MADDILIKELEALGVDNYQDKAIVLEEYLSQILLFNPTLKLVGEVSRDDILCRHILDSASAYPVFLKETQSGDSIADLGSGAGLPGIVLSILLPDRKFFLIERMQRRVGFLRGVKALLSLDNVEIVDKDIKDIKRSFSLITCRAFHPLYDIAPQMISLSSKGVFYKGMRKTIDQELKELSQIYCFQSSIMPLSVVGEDSERNIVVLKEWRRK